MLNPQKEHRAGNIIILCYDVLPQTRQLETTYSINYDALRSVSVGGVRQTPELSYTIDGSLVVFSEDLPVGIVVQIEIENNKLTNHENTTKIFIVHGHD